MALLYSNENFPLPVVKELRRLGHDVLTVLEAGKAEQAIEDEDVLAFAVSLGRAVLTINRKHFIRLHRQQPSHAGIIVCTYDPDFVGQATRIHAALQSQSQLAGQIVTRSFAWLHRDASEAVRAIGRARCCRRVGEGGSGRTGIAGGRWRPVRRR